MEKEYIGKVPFTRVGQFVPEKEAWEGTFDHHLFSITLGGGATYQHPEGSFTVKTGDFLHFSPLTWQEWTSNEEDGWTVSFLILEIPSQFNRLLLPEKLAPGIGRARLEKGDLERATICFSTMDAWLSQPNGLSNEIILNQLEYVLLLVQSRLEMTRIDPRIEKARSFLHRQIEKPTRLEDVAEAARLSRARLCALFREELKTTPLQYLEDLRMERATQLLRFTSYDIESIARTLGYEERKYFDKRFKRSQNLTPYQYRKHSARQLLTR